MKDSRPLTGEVLPKVTGAVSSIDAAAALNNMVSATKEYLVLKQEQETKRTEIQTYERLEIARIQAAERVLHDYFAQAFAERRHNFDELFQRFDRAAEAGDVNAMQVSLGTLVKLAEQSPLAALTDLGSLRAALDDPDHEWKF